MTDTFLDTHELPAAVTPAPADWMVQEGHIEWEVQTWAP